MIPEAEFRGPGAGLPEKVWLGRRNDEGRIYAFESEGDAQQWQADDDLQIRRIWEVSTEHAVERVVRVIPESHKWA